MSSPRITDPLNTYPCAPTSWSECCSNVFAPHYRSPSTLTRVQLQVGLNSVLVLDSLTCLFILSTLTRVQLQVGLNNILVLDSLTRLFILSTLTRVQLHVGLNCVLVLDSLARLVDPLNTCPFEPRVILLLALLIPSTLARLHFALSLTRLVDPLNTCPRAPRFLL